MTPAEALASLLDQVDYTADACRPNEPVGACLQQELIALCRKVLAGERARLDREAITLTPIIDLEMTCEACPSQWQARTLDGQHVYVRYRFGLLEVGISATLDSAVASIRSPDAWFRKVIGEQYDGVISWAEVSALTGLVEQK